MFAVDVALRQQFIDSQIFNLGHFFGDEGQIPRSVTRTPIGYRGQVGCIGFEDQLRKRCQRNGGADVVRFVKCHHAVEAQVEARVQGKFSQLKSGAEAVDNAATSQLRQVLGENRLHIVVCISAMDDNRELGLGGNRQLLCKDLALHRAVRMVVEIVEANFPNRQHFGVLNSSADLLSNVWVVTFRFMWMNPLCTVNMWRALRDLSDRVQVIRAHCNRDDALDTDPLGRGQFFRETFRVQIIEVTVRFYNRLTEMRNFTTLFFAHGVRESGWAGRGADQRPRRADYIASGARLPCAREIASSVGSPRRSLTPSSNTGPRERRAIDVLLPAFVLALLAGFAVAAEPYGKQFVRLDAARLPAIGARPIPVAADIDMDLEVAPELRAEMLEALRMRVATEEAEGGPYAPALAETLADLARLLEAAGDDKEAMRVRERALHLLRINQGLNAPEQGPLVRAILESLRRAGDIEALDERYDYFFRLYGLGRPPWSGPRWDATLEYLRWQRDALKLELGGDPYRRLLNVYGLHDELLEVVAAEPADLAGGNWARQRDLVLSQLGVFYLIEDMVQPIPDPIQLRGQLTRPRDPMDFDPMAERLEGIRRSLRPRGKQMLMDLLEAIPATETVARAEVKLALADWLQWFGSTREAGIVYLDTWQALHDQGQQVLAQSWFERPVPLPDNGVFIPPDATVSPAVPIVVSVSPRGRARAQSNAVRASDSRTATRLRRYLNATQFRPAIASGRFVEAELPPEDYVLFEP